jgi:hypothetical protein
MQRKNETSISRQSIFFDKEKVPRSRNDVRTQPIFYAKGIIYAQIEKSYLKKKHFQSARQATLPKIGQLSTKYLHYRPFIDGIEKCQYYQLHSR